ncbi:MAG: lpxD [Gammaproteobacteria bacterium]|jgi:UDP-3-O-[3-hydroxymyristoyl] glucosamine N-acyltransferase|nr:lpxD [Gammaproteobacteria bacterium]
MVEYTVAKIASHIGATVSGDSHAVICGMAPLQSAKPTELSFLDNPRYRSQLAKTKAGAVIITAEEVANCPVTALIVTHPYVAYAKAAVLFDTQSVAKPGVHPSAVVDLSAAVAKTASIGAHCVIGANVVIAEHVVIGAGSVVENDCLIGANTCLRANVTLYPRSKIGERCLLHSGVVIGSDGFGMAKNNAQWLKVPQLGGVVIGNDVEIGANTVIDRGALSDTRIGNDVKLDNLIQVAHNVEIGDHTAIAACTGIAGSTTIGEHCLIGGGVCINGHIQITDNVAITGMSGVPSSITKPGVYSSGVDVDPAVKAKRNAVRYRQLDKMAQRLNELEKQLNDKSDKR